MDLIALLVLAWAGKRLVDQTRPVKRNSSTESGSQRGRTVIDPRTSTAIHNFLVYYRRLADQEQRALFTRLNERQAKQFNHLFNQTVHMTESQQIEFIKQQELNGFYQDLGQWALSEGNRLMGLRRWKWF
ncbi:MAG: hypothetical protein ACM3ZQ_05150 [Bacillota bacterium]